MKKVGIILGIIFVFFLGYFGVAVTTSPVSAMEAITNPGDTLTLLFYKIARLEERVANLEARIAALEKGEQPEWKPPTEKELPESDFPYFAQLPPELEGKIEVRYKFFFKTAGTTPEEQTPQMLIWEGRLKNLSNQRIYEIVTKGIAKDSKGDVIQELGGCQNLFSKHLVEPGELRGIGGAGAGGDWLREWLKNHDPESIFVKVIVIKVKFA